MVGRIINQLSLMNNIIHCKGTELTRVLSNARLRNSLLINSKPFTYFHVFHYS